MDDLICPCDSSIEEVELRKTVASIKPESNPPLLEVASSSDDDDVVDDSLAFGTRYQVSSVVCSCLRSLLILVNGLTRLSSNIDHYLFYSNGLEVLNSMSIFSYNIIHTLAKCCNSGNAIKPIRTIVVNEDGVINYNYCESVVFPQNESSQNASFVKQMDDLSTRYFVDVFIDTDDLSTAQKEISDFQNISELTYSESM
ncbi:unnamed protein product [Trichobilharzia regenti]|nr:unnamed protein product [Trichobilharzia regenti]